VDTLFEDLKLKEVDIAKFAQSSLNSLLKDDILDNGYVCSSVYLFKDSKTDERARF
jgi:hypothetical protein